MCKIQYTKNRCPIKQSIDKVLVGFLYVLARGERRS